MLTVSWEQAILQFSSKSRSLQSAVTELPGSSALWTNQEPPGAAPFEVGCLVLVQCFPSQLSPAKASPLPHLPSLSTRVFWLSTAPPEPALDFSRPFWELVLEEAQTQLQPLLALTGSQRSTRSWAGMKVRQDSDVWVCWCSWLA